MPMPLSSDKLHLTMTKSSTFSGLRDALLAVTTFPAAENTLSDFELAAGTGKTILTRCERSVKLAEPAWLRDSFPRKETECGLVQTYSNTIKSFRFEHSHPNQIAAHFKHFEMKKSNKLF